MDFKIQMDDDQRNKKMANYSSKEVEVKYFL